MRVRAKCSALNSIKHICVEDDGRKSHQNIYCWSSIHFLYYKNVKEFNTS